FTPFPRCDRVWLTPNTYFLAPRFLFEHGVAVVIRISLKMPGQAISHQFLIEVVAIWQNNFSNKTLIAVIFIFRIHLQGYECTKTLIRNKLFGLGSERLPLFGTINMSQSDHLLGTILENHDGIPVLDADDFVCRGINGIFFNDENFSSDFLELSLIAANEQTTKEKEKKLLYYI